MATLVCMFLGILLPCIAADIIVEDWFSQKLKNISTLVIDKQSATGYQSRLGYISHLSSNRFIHPKRSQNCPINLDPLVIYNGADPSTGKVTFKFVQVTGHLGYIRHSCGKDIHPINEHMRPPEGTKMVTHDNSHAGALFYVDEEKKLIVHRGGGILSPSVLSPFPQNGDPLCIRYGINDARRFEFLDDNLNPFSVYPKPSLNGRWEVLYAVLNPLVNDHSYQICYKVGRSVSRSATQMFAWKVSALAALNWFRAISAYTRAATYAGSKTWTAEVTDQLDLRVQIGEPIVVWQYIFEANQFGDGLRFRSTIIRNTKGLNIPPANI